MLMPRLSPRKLQVAKLIAEGHTYREIAKIADLSYWTVKDYAELIAEEIQSDLPAKVRIQVWYRLNFDLNVMTGEPLLPVAPLAQR